MHSPAAGLADAFARDGVVRIPGALDDEVLRLALDAFEWSVEHPGPAAGHAYDGVDGAFLQDLCNPACAGSAPYQRLLQEPSVAAIVADLWQEPDVWFMYEQIFLKEGAGARRSSWHQDASYIPIDGAHLAVMWITFDPVPAGESLEFVRGSHRCTLYNTTRFDPEDETAPLLEGLPRLPDIEADRAAWDIVTWPVTPGDVVVFHPATLHGGGPTSAGRRRRTLSLRFFGADATYGTRPGGGIAPKVPGLDQRLGPGDPFRDPSFVRLAGT